MAFIRSKRGDDDRQELIKNAFDDLLASLWPGTTKESKQLIKKAFDFANEAHKWMKRRSGEPYILHPIAVAKITARRSV